MRIRPSTSLSLMLGAILTTTALTPAIAQDAPATGTAEDSQTDSSGEIVVTGSRLTTELRDATAPITSVSSADLERVGAGTTYDLLRRVPFVAMGEGSPNNNGDQENSGAGFMNLRNLGANRSLTLVNGRRRVSGGANMSGVDLNMIPAGLVERIDIVTGGTSAIYGADAVTGVTNILLKTDYDGLELSGHMGQSEHGGADYYTANLLAGSDFAGGRGHITVGLSYLSRDGLMQSDREFSRPLTTTAANPANTGPADGIPDRLDYTEVQYIYTSFQPTFYYGNTSYIVDGGNVRAGYYQIPITYGATSYGSGGDGRNINDTRKLYDPIQTLSATANLTYDFSDALTAYVNSDYTHSYNDGWYNYYRADKRTSFLNGYGGLRVDLANPFLPASVRDFMVTNGLTTLNIDKTYGEFGIITNVHKRDLINVETGLRGKLTDTLRWEAFVQYGRSEDHARSDNVPLADHLIQASQVTVNAQGAAICKDATARAQGCVPYNIFSGEPVTGALRDYILYTRHNSSTNTLFVTGAQVNGEVFDLPAGAVKIATGVEYRRESLSTRDDPLSLNGQASHSGTWRDAHPNLDESFNVKEVFAEIRVPLLADKPFLRELSVDGAYRFSDYSTIGSTSAWKVGGLWAPVEDLRLRATLSRSVRAPNLFELFGPSATSFTNPSDPCEVGQYNSSAKREANCAALGIASPLAIDQSPVTFTSGSNANLKEEVSNSWTVGFTFAPRFIPGLSVSADYWDISIEDAVQSYSFQNIVNYCTNLTTVQNDFCAQVTRDPTTHQIVAINGTSINVAELKARGVDFSVSYARPLAGGTVMLGVNGTRLIKKTSQLVPGDASFLVTEDGGLSNPRLRANFNLGYQYDRFGVTVSNRYISKVKVDPMATDEYYEHPTAAARVYTDLDLTFDLNDRYGVSLGVNNLLDVEPPYSSSNTTLVGNYGLYDTIGRYFKLGFNARF